LGAESFAIVHIMTVGPGGPADSTTVLPLLVYQKAFVGGPATQGCLSDADHRRAGYSAAE
ncbi:hypothetical protein CLM82_29365, partial [Streptomyces albidoflavus]